MPNQLLPYRVSISVSSVDKSAVWYQDMLGFQLSSRAAFNDYGVCTALLEKDGFSLELIERRGSQSIRARFPELQDETLLQGYKKLAFKVDHLDEMVIFLKKKRVKFSFDVTLTSRLDEKMKWCIIEDPDGNWLQLLGI